MKKLIVTSAAILCASSAFAYSNVYPVGWAMFTLFINICSIVLLIIILVRWWKMTSNVENICRHVTHANTKLTYLVAIGEIESAQKGALKMLVDKMYPIYFDSTNYEKAESMNREIAKILPQIQNLGLVVADYASSGEKFIDYMNGLTGRNVKYKESYPY